MPDRLPAGITALIPDATSPQDAQAAVAAAVYDWLRGIISGDRLVQIAVHHRAVIQAGDDPGLTLAWPDADSEPVAGVDYLPPAPTVAILPFTGPLMDPLGRGRAA